MMQIYNANYNDVSELIQNFVLMAMETNTVAAVVKPNFLQHFVGKLQEVKVNNQNITINSENLDYIYEILDKNSNLSVMLSLVKHNNSYNLVVEKFNIDWFNSFVFTDVVFIDKNCDIAIDTLKCKEKVLFSITEQ